METLMGIVKWGLILLFGNLVLVFILDLLIKIFDNRTTRRFSIKKFFKGWKVDFWGDSSEVKELKKKLETSKREFSFLQSQYLSQLEQEKRYQTTIKIQQHELNEYSERIESLKRKHQEEKIDLAIEFAEEKEELEKEIQTLKDALAHQANSKKGFEGAKAKFEQERTQLTNRIKDLEYQISELKAQMGIIEKTKSTEIDLKLTQMIRRTSLAQRYISEMYQRGVIDLDKRKEIIAKTEIIQEIENKIITEKNVQILTREGRLQLETNTSAFALQKSAFELEIKLNNFNLDKRDYEYNTRIETEKWEIKKQLDNFDLKQQRHVLQILADSLQDKERKHELQILSDRLDLEKTRAELQQFSNNLQNEKQRIEIQKILNDFDLDKQNFDLDKKGFDLDKQRQELVNYANKLENQKEKAELLHLADKLDLEKTKNDLVHFSNTLELKEERHQIQSMIDNFDIEKGRTALIQAKEKFLIHIERESHELQTRINQLDGDQKRHDLQQMMDNFNADVREKRGELEDMKRNISLDVRQHDLQKQMDGFNIEMKEQTHSLKILHDSLQIKEQKFDLKVERERLEVFNKEMEGMKKAIQEDYDRKKELLQLRLDRGELEAQKQLIEIREKNIEVQTKLTDLQFSKREIENFATEKEQELLRKELKYKQEILYAIYDQLEMENPEYVDKVFGRMGYMENSPYKEKLNECEGEKWRLQQELEKERARKKK